MTAADFVRAHTRLAPVPFVPELRLHQADDAFALWERTERYTGGHHVGRVVLPPPFWAFAWAGGQALARHLLDHPHLVRGRAVFDLASGSGLVAIAAAKAGASAVTASEIDRLAVTAMDLNAAANGVTVSAALADVLAPAAAELHDAGAPAAVVLAGDVFYQRAFADRALPFLERAHARGALVLVGDPGRTYLPRARLTPLAAYDVPVPQALEDATVKRSTVWSL